MPEPVAVKREALKIVDGVVIDKQVKMALCPLLAHGSLKDIHAIVMHQTVSLTAQSTLNGYRSLTGDHYGAHFLIDKDGTIYQTLQVTLKCLHVGKLISRCLTEVTCSKEDAATYKKMGFNPSATNALENKKSYPSRYPHNEDSIGIESVGMAYGSGKVKVFENPTPQQNASSHWLVSALLDALHLNATDVYRHPMVSIKMPTEAQGVTW